MAVVAGVVFFAVRALLALIPVLAMRYPIKKWAALAALLAALFYLLLSGAEVATQRSFMMTGLLLLAVMVDRAALTFRNLALAALGVMLLAPEAVVHPSFQMSLAATLALMTAYEVACRHRHLDGPRCGARDRGGQFGDRRRKSAEKCIRLKN